MLWPERGGPGLLWKVADSIVPCFEGAGGGTSERLLPPHQRGISDFSQMTDLSKGLREKLERHCVISAPEVIYEKTSKTCGAVRAPQTMVSVLPRPTTIDTACLNVRVPALSTQQQNRTHRRAHTHHNHTIITQTTLANKKTHS